MTQQSKKNGIGDKLEAGCLVVICLVVWALNVPAQWTGIATEPSFTAWIAPISNRLQTGPRLYEWGTHMPLPPLSHVLLYLATWGHATWLTESAAHQTAVVLSILILYFFLRGIFPRPISFLGALAALATASTTMTILFYNSLAHLLVICMAVLVAIYFRDAKRDASPPEMKNLRPKRWRLFLWLGVASAAAVLAKQSIGGMAVIGCTAVVWLAPGPGGIFARARNVVFYGVSTGAAFGVLCLLMYPWVNPGGLIKDVFLIGSECKGGMREVLGKLGGFSEQMFSLFGLAFFVTLIVVGSRLYPAAKPQEGRESQSNFIARLAAVAAISFFLLIVAAIGLHKSVYTATTLFESVGLGACLFAVATVALPSFSAVSLWREFAGEPWQTLGCLTLVLLPAAMGYNLSMQMLLREVAWRADNIPLCQVALVALFWLITSAVKAICRGAPARAVSALVIGATTLAMVFIWYPPWVHHWKILRQCTDEWTDCAWFKGARVTTSARSLHELVQRVRPLAGADGTVLVLPEDPNFEACLARPRPAVSCAIIYFDQYWKRYLEPDLQSLAQTPPKVIIVGPENSWRQYGRERNTSNSVEVLIDRLQIDLLPTRYHLEFRQTIPFGNHGDTLAVYVRNE